jgi:hypothetical protein
VSSKAQAAVPRIVGLARVITGPSGGTRPA